jgi:hypothetical protein
MHMTQWTPRAGWNSIFSAEEQQKGSDVFHNLMQTCEKNDTNSVLRLTDATAETVVMMKMYQEKYPGLRYSEAQERILHQYVTPVIPVKHTAPHRAPMIHKAHCNPHAPPFVPRIAQHTRTPYVSLLSVHREQHKGEHGHKKENRLNEHARHSESAVGQKRDGRPKEALKHPRGLGVRK